MNSRFLIGHLDSGSPPNHPSLDGEKIVSIAFNEAGDFQAKPLKSNQYSHSNLSARIIFEDDSYSLPALNSKTKLVTVSISSRGKTILNFLKGMDFLLDKAPKIVCMPIGFRQPIPIFYPMIRAFHKKGIHTIVPIGNSGIGNAHVPGCYPNVISVGAIDASGKVAQYSGSYLDDSGNCLKPDILALGNSLPMVKKKSKKGTSFACSYITGVVARLLQAQPQANSEEIKQALFSTTQPLTPSQSNRCKRGIVQAEKALEFLHQKNKIDFSKIEDIIPSFLKEPYQDPHFLAKFRNAKPDDLLEAILIPQANQEKIASTKRLISQSQYLISQIQSTHNLVPTSTHFFNHADMVHIIAKPIFFKMILEYPKQYSISAVDVSIFEM